MSVLIKGMEMPENCIKCPLQFGGWCYASPPEVDERVAQTVDEAWEQGKPDWCPLVALPDKHGRLVDAGVLIEQMEADAEHMDEPYAKMMYCAAISDVRHAPTIVEAEGESCEK